MLSQCIKQLGIKSFGLSVENFPTKLDPEYLTVWASFIGSRTCYDLWHMHKDPAAQMVEACLGFCSAISVDNSKFVRSTQFNLTALSKARAFQEVKDLSVPLRKTLATKFGWLPNRRLHVSMDYTENKLLGAQLPNTLTLIYEIGSPRDLDSGIRKNSQLFADPSKLFKPCTQRDLQNPRNWVEVVGSGGIMCARLPNTLALRQVVYPNTIVYRTRLNQLKTMIEGRL